MYTYILRVTTHLRTLLSSIFANGYKHNGLATAILSFTTINTNWPLFLVNICVETLLKFFKVHVLSVTVIILVKL